MSLLLGKNHVSLAEVEMVPTPLPTATWKPIAHRDLVRVVKSSIADAGLEIVRSDFVLEREGQRLFGIFELLEGNSEMSWSVGLRSSLDRSLAIGICAGNIVQVCTNLSFASDFVAFRRHTSGLDMLELESIANRSMHEIVRLLKSYQCWHESLKGYPLTEEHVKILTIEIMTQNVIPASKFHQFNNLLRSGYGQDLWGLHESVSDLWRGGNPFNLQRKNKVLNQVIDNYIYSLESVGSSSLGDFYQERAIVHR